MTHAKRQRGRPKGSGLNDGPRLDRIADLMIARPGLKPTTAIKQTDPAPNDTEIRRLQGKWSEEGEARLAAAHERQAVRRAAQAQRSAARRSGSGTGIGAIAEMERQLRAAERLANLARGIDSLTPSAVADAAAGIDRSTAAIQAIYDSPAMRLARGLDDSPTMRLVREMENSPTMRLMRELENGPTARLARKMDRWSKLGF